MLHAYKPRLTLKDAEDRLDTIYDTAGRGDKVFEIKRLGNARFAFRAVQVRPVFYFRTEREAEVFGVLLHSTVVYQACADKVGAWTVDVDTGGYNTRTTRAAMYEAGPALRRLWPERDFPGVCVRADAKTGLLQVRLSSDPAEAPVVACLERARLFPSHWTPEGHPVRPWSDLSSAGAWGAKTYAGKIKAYVRKACVTGEFASLPEGDADEIITSLEEPLTPDWDGSKSRDVLRLSPHVARDLIERAPDPAVWSVLAKVALLWTGWSFDAVYCSRVPFRPDTQARAVRRFLRASLGLAI
jgi:hypothetical protein